MAIGSQLLFAGTQALNNAKPILAKLVSDLTNHVGDAATIENGFGTSFNALYSPKISPFVS